MAFQKLYTVKLVVSKHMAQALLTTYIEVHNAFDCGFYFIILLPCQYFLDSLGHVYRLPDLVTTRIDIISSKNPL